MSLEGSASSIDDCIRFVSDGAVATMGAFVEMAVAIKAVGAGVVVVGRH